MPHCPISSSFGLAEDALRSCVTSPVVLLLLLPKVWPFESPWTDDGDGSEEAGTLEASVTIDSI